MPTLLPLVSGPGWDESVKIAICLGIGSAIAVPSRLIYSAFSATARPEFSLVANCLSFVGTLVVLICTASLGPISVGLSRIVGDALQAAIAILASPRNFGWSCRDRFYALAPAWGLGIIMGVLVGLLGVAPPIFNRSLTLAVLVLFGVATYAALLFAFARNDLARMITVWPTRRASHG